MTELREQVIDLLLRHAEFGLTRTRETENAGKCADEVLALIQGGWRVVPVEPTREMLIAAGKYEDQCAVGNYGGRADAEGLWDAMLSAAPPMQTPAPTDKD